MKHETRDSRPQFIGAAINNLLRKMGAKQSDSDLSARWHELFGDDSELVKISRGTNDRTIYIRAKNPSARITLSYQADEFIKKLNKYFGYEAISKVVIK